MTTASSAFTAMEVPAGEDLEMASPYQGQADDFDIDIDLMEDQEQDRGSNMDSDMLGAEDLFNTSHPSLFPNDPTDDADMADDPSEGSMVDADTVPDNDQDIDLQFEDVPQEAEMLEDDSTTAAHPVLPSINVEIMEPAQEEQTQPFQPSQPPETTEVPGSGNIHEAPSTSAPVEILPQQSNTIEPASLEPALEPASLEPQATEKVETENPPQQDLEDNAAADHHEAQNIENTDVVADAVSDTIPGTVTEETNTAPKEDGTDSIDKSDNNEATSETVPAHKTGSAQPEQPPFESNVAPAPTDAQYDTGLEHEDETLHAVKVLYQDSEISLFPPLEGDSAETFFLHDEDMAYESCDKLFGALRDVLLDNIAEHEVLVIDIESLGIQLTEDSIHAPKTTLHQLLTIYLRLCRNDNIEEPEALYLSLSTKPDVPFEINNLESAAAEGKGLSSIKRWDDDEEAEKDSSDVQDEDDAGIDPENHAQEEASEGPRPLSHGEDAANGTGPNPEDTVADSQTKHEETHDGPDAHETLAQEDRNDEREQSEGLKTESTNTLVPNSTESVGPSPENEDDFVNVEDDQGYHGQDDEYQEGDDGEYDGENDHAQNDAEGTDVPEYEGGHDHFDDEEGHNGLDDHHEAHDVAKFQEGDGENDGENDGELYLEDEHNDFHPDDGQYFAGDKESHEESEATLDNPPPDTLEPNHGHQTFEPEPEPEKEPEDDILEVPEETIQSSAKQEPVDRIDFEDNDAEFHEDEFDDLGSHENELNEPQQDNEDGFDGTEEFELGEIDPPTNDSQAFDTLSTKRSREEEDEWDIEDSKTPETKRRRPS